MSLLHYLTSKQKTSVAGESKHTHTWFGSTRGPVTLSISDGGKNLRRLLQEHAKARISKELESGSISVTEKVNKRTLQGPHPTGKCQMAKGMWLLLQEGSGKGGSSAALCKSPLRSNDNSLRKNTGISCSRRVGLNFKADRLVISGLQIYGSFQENFTPRGRGTFDLMYCMLYLHETGCDYDPSCPSSSALARSNL